MFEARSLILLVRERERERERKRERMSDRLASLRDEKRYYDVVK